MSAVANYLSLIKFSHTIFALPFAIIGFFWQHIILLMVSRHIACYWSYCVWFLPAVQQWHLTVMRTDI